MKAFVLICALLQNTPFQGTYISTEQTLILNKNKKCTLTVPTSWHGYKEKKFTWRPKEGCSDAIELLKLGIVQFTFVKKKFENDMYLVELKQEENFNKYCQILESEKPSETSSKEFEKYVIAKSKIGATLKRCEK